MCQLYNFTMGPIVNAGECASKLHIILISKSSNLYNMIPAVSAPISRIIEIHIPATAPVICDILFVSLFSL